MTPEQFLTQPSTDEDDLDSVGIVDPLASIAESLRAIASHLTEDAWVQEKADDKASENADLHAELRRAHEEVDDLHAVIEQVRALVKPSTSKLANSIRAALDPQAPPLPLMAADPDKEDPPADSVPDGPPAPDALVEAWRGYARRLGYTGPDVDVANRSQIRTMLGIPQPADVDRG